MKPQLKTVPGVADIDSLGGYEKQYVVEPDTTKLVNYGLSYSDIAKALQAANLAVGANYIQRGGEAYLVHADARIHSMDEIGRAVIATHNSVPGTINDVAKLHIGGQFRTGAASKNGHEVVIGTALMLTGENSRTVATSVREKFLAIRSNLPPGIVADVLLDRSQLVNATITTVGENLAIGALLVAATLFLLLGNARAAIIATAVIPLSFVMAATGMNALGVPANLMSLGALDFGLIIDGAVIIVENTLRRIAERQARLGRVLDREERLAPSVGGRSGDGSSDHLWADRHLPCVRTLPLFSGRGRKNVLADGHHSDAGARRGLRIVSDVRPGDGGHSRSWKAHGTRGSGYSRRQTPLRTDVAKGSRASAFRDRLAALRRLAPRSLYSSPWDERSCRRLMRSISTWRQCESRRFRSSSRRSSTSGSNAHSLRFPKSSLVFSKAGTADLVFDAMPSNASDNYVILKPKDQWPPEVRTKEDVQRRIQEATAPIVGNFYEMTQPIQMRFNELISGARSDVTVAIYGDDLDQWMQRRSMSQPCSQGRAAPQRFMSGKPAGFPSSTSNSTETASRVTA